MNENKNKRTYPYKESWVGIVNKESAPFVFPPSVERERERKNKKKRKKGLKADNTNKRCAGWIIREKKNEREKERERERERVRIRGEHAYGYSERHSPSV